MFFRSTINSMFAVTNNPIDNGTVRHENCFFDGLNKGFQAEFDVKGIHLGEIVATAAFGLGGIAAALSTAEQGSAIKVAITGQ